jgi:hypothetical protein
MKRLLALLLLVLGISLSLRGSAASIYIAQTAAGSANGADCADAYAYSFFNTGGNWGSGSTQIGPGTEVHVCGTWSGSAGQQFLTVQGSGTSGNPVTIHFETNAIMEAPYFSGTSGAINVGANSYITVDGGTNGIIENTLNGTAGASCPAGPAAISRRARRSPRAARPTSPCKTSPLRTSTSTLRLRTP